MSFITDFLEILGAWLTGFWGLVSETIDGALSIFWKSPDGTAPAELTIMGVLLLFGLAVGLVYMGLMFVRGLIRK